MLPRESFNTFYRPNFDITKSVDNWQTGVLIMSKCPSELQLSPPATLSTLSVTMIPLIL